MLLGLLAMCILVMLRFAETSLARLLHRVLVDAPLDWIAKTKRQDVIFLLVTAALFLTAGEFLAIFGPAELLALSLNLSFYFDALLVTSAIAAAGLATKAVKVLRAHHSLWRTRAVKRIRSANREVRTRSSGTRKSLDLEDDPVGALGLAAGHPESWMTETSNSFIPRRPRSGIPGPINTTFGPLALSAAAAGQRESGVVSVMSE